MDTEQTNQKTKDMKTELQKLPRETPIVVGKTVFFLKREEVMVWDNPYFLPEPVAVSTPNLEESLG